MATERLPSPEKPPSSPEGSGASAKARLRAAYFLYFAGISWLAAVLLAKPATGNPRAACLQTRETVGRHSRNYLIRLAKMNCVHCEFIGFEDARAWRSSIICPNHPSILDAIFLFQQFPQAGCVVGINPWRHPLLSIPSRRAMYIPVHPALGMVKKSRQLLEDGGNMIVFPEGTRTPEGALGTFHDGFALAAIKAGATVRTVFIECSSMFLGKKFDFTGRTRLPIHFRISTGGVFHPAPTEDARVFSNSLEDYFRGRLRRVGDRISRVEPLL